MQSSLSAKKTFRVSATLPLLLSRLERLSADSPLAHRASGLRAALARFQDQAEAGQPADPVALKRLIEQGFRILEAAARERSATRFK
jgi:hypothetical protein